MGAVLLALVLAVDAGTPAVDLRVFTARRVVAELADGGTVELAPALVADEAAGLAIARELAESRVEEPILRAAPPPAPGWLAPLLVVVAVVAFGGGLATGLATKEPPK